MIEPEYLKLIAAEAHAFLRVRVTKALRDEGWDPALDPDECIQRHMAPPDDVDLVSRARILESILVSAQNRQDAANVILGSVDGGIATLRRLLHGFDPDRILATWPDRDALFRDLKASGDISGEMRDTKKSRWPQYCGTVLSAAAFVSRFETAGEFVEWLRKFRRDADLAAALPLVLEKEIFGFGLALACDFLKELGCSEYLKPDVHIWRLVRGLGLSDAKTDYMLLRDLMALEPALRKIGLTPYAFDKYLWLIGSGRFYQVVEDGYMLTIRRQAPAFLKRFAAIQSKLAPGA